MEAADAKTSLEEVRRKLTKEQISVALREEQIVSLSSNNSRIQDDFGGLGVP